MNYGTLPSHFLSAVEEHPSPRAQMFRGPERWEAISSQEMLRRVAGLGNAFVELGVKSGDRVALFAPNCPEWHTADLAISGSGGATVPIYFNESPDRMAYILNHSGAQLLFISGRKQLQRFLAARELVKDVQQVIVANAGDDLPLDFLCYKTLIAATGPSEIAAYRLCAAKVLPS